MITKFKIYEDLDNNKDLERLRNRYITYSSREEMIMVVKKLIELDIKTYRTLDSYKNSKRLHRFFYYNKGDNAFVRSSDESILKGLYELPFEDFMKLGKKKYMKRKPNLNIDPYGEEEWGFDVIKNENIHNEIDPYGEEDWEEPEELKVGDKVYIDEDTYGKIFAIWKSGPLEGQCSIYTFRYDSPGRGWVQYYTDYMYKFKKLKKIKKLKESVYNEIDPYGEDNWGDKDFQIGDKIYVKDGHYGIIIGILTDGTYVVDYYDKFNRNYGYGERSYHDLKRLDEKFTLKSNIKKIVYYTQNFIDKEKVNKLINIVNENWIKNNPVAFETYKGKLFLTEGHHRFEACLKKNDQRLLKALFDSALYYNINYEPRSYKKKIIILKENNIFKKIYMLNENNNRSVIKSASDFIKQQIKNTKWENKVYIVGGAVRDEIMGNESKDLDLMVDEENGGIDFALWITKKLKIYTKGNPIIYPRFGTAKFNFRGITHNGYDLSNLDVESVMPRSEKYVAGSRNPDVEFTTLKNDAERRDITANSLFKNITSDEILDLTGQGINDIKKGIVRSPIDPDIIFKDDPLRMMRTIRASVKYGWDLPMFMIKSIKKNSKKLEYISAERIQDELNKMLISKYPSNAIRLLQITGLSKYIFPELDKLVKLQQNKYHKFDAMRHTLEVLKNTPPDLVTRLAALFHDIGKYKTKSEENGQIHFYNHETMSSNIAKDIMKRLRYPHSIIDQVVICIENHMRTKQMGDKVLTGDKVLRKLRMDLGDNLDRVLDLIHADNLSHSDEYNMPNQIPILRSRFKELGEKDKEVPVKPPLSGNDVIDILGISKGPMVGRILRALTDVYLEKPGLSKEELTQIVKNIYSNLV